MYIYIYIYIYNICMSLLMTLIESHVHNFCIIFCLCFLLMWSLGDILLPIFDFLISNFSVCVVSVVCLLITYMFFFSYFTLCFHIMLYWLCMLALYISLVTSIMKTFVWISYILLFMLFAFVDNKSISFDFSRNYFFNLFLYFWNYVYINLFSTS